MSIDKLSSKLQGGKLTAVADENFDTATLIIIAQAPEEVDDRLYAKAKSLPYTVKIIDKGAQVVAADTGVDVKPMITAYAEAAASLDAGNEAAVMIAMNSISAAAGTITRTVSAELALGNSASLDTLSQMLENGEIEADNIRPILRQLADVAQFNAEASSSDALRQKAQQLRAY
jgi:hypothetical protein